jgi:hypothetical protein
MKDTDPVAAALEEIRERYAARPGDVERLLAVADSALELVTEWKQIPFAVRASDECADELRTAITAALTGGDADRG